MEKERFQQNAMIRKVSIQRMLPVPGRLAVANILHNNRAFQRPFVPASSRCTV